MVGLSTSSENSVRYFEEVKNQTVFLFPFIQCFIAILAIASVSVTEMGVKPNAPGMPDLRNLSVPVSNRLDLNYFGI